jgi:hypothetical protein
MGTKNEIYQRFVDEYRTAAKDRKTEIINTIVETTKSKRKSVIRRMRDFLLYGENKPKKKRGRKTKFGIGATAALKTVWEIGGWVCGILLYPSIEEYVPILKRDGDWKHSDEATTQLLAMSEATVRRRVSGLRKKNNIKGASTTSPSKIKTTVPVYAGSWRSQKPGAGQTDTVVHCGPILMGDMAYTLTFVSVVIGWIVLRAQWNKGEIETTKSVAAIEEKLPWPVEWIHSDSGGEFIQWDLIAWAKEKKIRFTRCRRGKKNDNAYVEERNGHVVRKWVGDDRYDCPESVVALNAYYDVLMFFLNHFVAIRKTLSKSREGGKYKRVHDKARTPYARALAHPNISEDVKEKLRKEHATLNPLRLSKKLGILKKALFVIQKRHGNRKFRV